MATRQSAVKTLLDEPKSVLAREWLEAYHGGSGSTTRSSPGTSRAVSSSPQTIRSKAKNVELYELDGVALIGSRPFVM